MKGVCLCGGTGSRLLPLTRVTSKHLLPVGRDVMMSYPIRKLVEAGIKDILIVTGTEHMGDVVGYFGSGKDFGCEFTYRVQDRAGGIAEALGLARGFAAGQRMCVLLGDNLFEDKLAPFAERFEYNRTSAGGARVLLKEVPDPERFGVAEVVGGRIASIEEKPSSPKSSYAVTGCYFYSPDVFDIIAGLKPSARGETEISDVNRAYLERGLLGHDVLRGWWSDAGTHESLARAARLIAR